MAVVHPKGWEALSGSGAAERELQTLRLLAGALPDDYSIWHAVHWTRLREGFSVVGEIDFVIAGPSGRVLLIEQKSGFLAETDDGLAKAYAGGTKSVPVQMRRSQAAVESGLRRLAPDGDVWVESLLYCPDYTVKSPGTAGIPVERIVDARRRDQLVPVVRQLLGHAEAERPVKSQLGRYFGDILQLVPDASAVLGEAAALYTRISGGLATWARRIEVTPHRLRVRATAGSGKTQLALAVLREAGAAARRALYVCYNRPLADHIALIAPPQCEVATYHQLCDRVARRLGAAPDFAAPGAFEALERALDVYRPAASDLFDDLVIDEGQEFRQSWADNLLRMVAPAGRVWWLEDPMQNLYGRDAVALPGWVHLNAPVNHRSPRAVIDFLRAIAPGPLDLEAGSPIGGDAVEVLAYDDTRDMIAQTVKAVTRCVARGFRRDSVAVVTYRGREHSALSPYDRLGPYALRAFSGRYDLLGNPIHAEGDVLLDSVHRFKGRAAPAVVLSEVDFAALDETAWRRLFVGATRATMKLVVVASARSAAMLGGASPPA